MEVVYASNVVSVDHYSVDGVDDVQPIDFVKHIEGLGFLPVLMLSSDV